MVDLLTAEERCLIDDHLFAVGVSICAPGEFTEDVVSHQGGGQMSKDARTRSAQRQRRFEQIKDDTRTPVPSARTSLIIEMAKTMTAREIAAASGMKRNSVSTRLRKHGVKPVAQSVRDQEARGARRAPIAAMMVEGMSAAEIGEKTGLSVSTVTSDINALVKLGATRVTPKDGPKISQNSKDRRARVRGMMSQGWSLTEMAAETGVSKTTIRWDIRMLERDGAVRVRAKPGRRVRLTADAAEPAKVGRS